MDWDAPIGLAAVCAGSHSNGTGPAPMTMDAVSFQPLWKCSQGIRHIRGGRDCSLRLWATYALHMLAATGILQINAGLCLSGQDAHRAWG